MRIKINTALLLLVMTVPMLHAQSAAPSAPAQKLPTDHTTYRLDFVLSEFENGKKVNARTYQMMLTEEHNAGSSTITRSRRESMRAGSRVPVVVGGSTSDGKTSAIQYMDIGVNIDCQFEGTLDDVILTGNVEVSGITVPPAGTDALRNTPVVRQSRVSFSSSIAPGKSVTIASIDEVDAPRRMQIDVTATKIK